MERPTPPKPRWVHENFTVDPNKDKENRCVECGRRYITTKEYKEIFYYTGAGIILGLVMALITKFL